MHRSSLFDFWDMHVTLCRRQIISYKRGRGVIERHASWAQEQPAASRWHPGKTWPHGTVRREEDLFWTSLDLLDGLWSKHCTTHHRKDRDLKKKKNNNNVGVKNCFNWQISNLFCWKFVSLGIKWYFQYLQKRFELFHLHSFYLEVCMVCELFIFVEELMIVWQTFYQSL